MSNVYNFKAYIVFGCNDRLEPTIWVHSSGFTSEIVSITWLHSLLTKSDCSCENVITIEINYAKNYKNKFHIALKPNYHFKRVSGILT